jgi:hypothetical protein
MEKTAVCIYFVKKNHASLFFLFFFQLGLNRFKPLGLNQLVFLMPTLVGVGGNINLF